MRIDPNLPFNSMSVRDFVAVSMMQAVLGQHCEQENIDGERGDFLPVYDSTNELHLRNAAKRAVLAADALIAELQKQEDEFVDRRHD